MAELINWGCQGVLLVAVASFCSRMWRCAPAAVRYRLWWVTLAALLMTPAAAVWTSRLPAAVDTPAGMAPIVELPPLSLVAPMFFALWGAVSVLSLSRIAAAALAIRRMKRACAPFPASREHRLKHWSAVRGSGRIARLAVSPALGSAAVLGGFAPVIAVSPSVLHQLDDDELDQIVLHEWAHVQRRDDVAQLLQQVIRAMFLLHPAVWWSVRQLQLERELACDERVAQLTGSPRRYAQCLARLATVVRIQRAAAMIPAALTRSQLSTRIGRLVQPNRPARQWSIASAGTGAILLVAALVTAVSIPLVGELGPQINEVITSARMAGATRSLRDPAAVSPVAIAAPMESRSGAGALKRAPGVTHSPTETVQIDRIPVARAPAIQDLFGSIANQPSRVPAAEPPSPIAPVPAGSTLTALPGTAVSIDAPSARAAADEPTSSATPWSAAAGAGIAIGRGSNKAARATAGFFTRMGNSFGGGF